MVAQVCAESCRTKSLVHLDLYQLMVSARPSPITCSTNEFVLSVVAGPSSLSQSVSRVLASGNTNSMNVLKGSPSVTLHVETFGMTR